MGNYFLSSRARPAKSRGWIHQNHGGCMAVKKKKAAKKTAKKATKKKAAKKKK